MRRSARRILRLSLATACVVALGAVLHAPVLRLVAGAMTVETPLERADLIVPLYQAPETVSRATAALFHAQYASRIALYDPRPTRLEALGVMPKRTDTWRRLLEADGVPPDAIIVIGRSVGSSRQLADAVVGVLGRDGHSRIILLASRPLSRIAWIDHRRAFAGLPVQLTLRAVPVEAFDERNWWQTRAGIITYFDAYCLWLLRWVR